MMVDGLMYCAETEADLETLRRAVRCFALKLGYWPNAIHVHPNDHDPGSVTIDGHQIELTASQYCPRYHYLVYWQTPAE